MHEEPTIRIETREELIYMLAEAAEVEHNVMCCYLYASWSLKRGERDGLTADEADKVRQWKAGISLVAVEEMTHLTLVCNLLSAIGAGPHLSRPNFPVSAGYHPSGVVVELLGFCPALIDHAIYLERPEGIDLHDGTDFVHPADYHRTQPKGRIMASAQDYETIGHLYRGIRHGLEVLSHHLGEEALFCGDVASQVGPGDAHLPGLCVVKDLASAIQAVETIIEQGEGAPDHSENSHYNKFVAVRDQYNAMTADKPEFQPAFPVAHNPVMYEPRDPEHRVHVNEPEAAQVLDLCNSIYGHMLRCLVQSFGRDQEDQETKQLFVGTAIELMESLVPIGEHLASLPANKAYPGINAGVTFTMLRDVAKLPNGASERQMMAERIAEIAKQARRIFPQGHELAGTADRVDALIKPFGVEELKTVGAVHTKAAPKPDNLPSHEGNVEVAEGRDMTLWFDGERCIHARFCVLGAPDVFLANTPGEWIFPDAMSADALVRIAYNCPSGAITYKRKDGGADEEAPPVNLINLRENGPYAFRGPLNIEGEEPRPRATLCRCGASQNKPFCDGSHVDIGFQATGEPATEESEPLSVRDGPVNVVPQKDGPLQVRGNL
ncbi:MAG: ferritin-like domain-containing protein, partial [Alphaproteobacteria bacterium]